MSPTDDLRHGLARAAAAVDVPGDPVARVRAEVGRRRGRRTRARLASASAGAAAVLVAGVVLVPGQLTTDATPPSSTPSVVDDEQGGVLLSPDGLPGLTLGSEPDLTGVDETQLLPTASGCVAADTRYTGMEALRPDSLIGTALVVWLRDGVVVSLVAFAVPDRVVVPGDVPRTWVGPTLRSPLAAALEVPGARLIKDDPFGADGPEVSNVVIDGGDGTELVLSDAPLVEGTPTPGRVTALVLRTEAGRGCQPLPGEDYLAVSPGNPDEAVVLDATDVGGLRVGGSVGRAEADGLLVRRPQDLGDPLDGRGCTSWTQGPGGLEVWADDDRIVALAALYEPAFRLAGLPAVASGAALADVRALPGASAASTATRGTGGAVDLPVGPGVRVRVGGEPDVVPAATTGVLVRGPEVVTEAVLYAGDEPATSLCAP